VAQEHRSEQAAEPDHGPAEPSPDSWRAVGAHGLRRGRGRQRHRDRLRQGARRPGCLPGPSRQDRARPAARHPSECR
jgi:hypothetical protein